jgi:hypothetical protein
MTATKEQTRYGDGADVGDILVAKWGYDQTNATWYRVERRTEKSVWLVELAGQTVDNTGFMQGHDVPTDRIVRRGNILGPCTGEVFEYEWDGEKHAAAICGKTEEHEAHQMGSAEPFRKTVKHSDLDGRAYVRMSSFEYARPWSGKPEWTSWYA